METDNKCKIAVIGAGNGGFAFAAWLVLRGYKTTLAEFPEFDDVLNPLRKERIIRMTGQRQENVEVETASSISEAVEGADIVMAVTPAHVHKRLADEIKVALSENAVVVLNPGRTMGALEVFSEFKKAGIANPVVEAQTLLFSCRKTGPTTVNIFGVKNAVGVAVMPSNKTPLVMEVLKAPLPEFYPEEDIRITGFSNIGAMFHPLITILNASRIESGIPFEFYHEGVTHSVGKLLESLDAERVEIASKFGVSVRSIKTWLNDSYDIKPGTFG